MRLVEVRLLGVPLHIQRRAAEHSAEVMREFTLLAEGSGAGHAPARLVALDRMLRERFGTFTEAARSELEAQFGAGATTAEACFSIPVEGGVGARELGAVWEEVDRYCQEGEYLLALKSPPDVVAFRRWVLEELARQAEGLPPRPWEQWCREARAEGVPGPAAGA